MSSDPSTIKSTLEAMGFDKNYIQRAIKVFARNYPDRPYNMELIIEIISRLEAKDAGKKAKKEAKKKKAKPPVAAKREAAAAAPPSHVSKKATPPPVPTRDVRTSAPSAPKRSSQREGPRHIHPKAKSKALPKPRPKPMGERAAAPPPPAFSAALFEVKPAPAAFGEGASSSSSRIPKPKRISRELSGPESITPGGGMEMGQVFQPGDVVYYKSPDAGSRIVKAEVLKVNGFMQVEISYPMSASVFERRRGIVHPRLIQLVPTKGGPGDVAPATGKPKVDDYGGNPFIPVLKLKDVMKLQIGHKVDHRDEVGRYVNAEIVERKGIMVKIHYIGWSHKWDCYSDLGKESARFARGESISRRPAHRFQHFKKGDFIDICPKLRHPGVWLAGEIRRLDKKSGQVQVVYEKDAKNYLYWAHLDDSTEIDEFTVRSGTSQSAQMEVLDEIKAKSERKRAKRKRKEERRRKRQEKRDRKAMWKHTADASQMETLRKLREKRFPLLRPAEDLKNPYSAGDWLEVQDAQTGRWILAIVMDNHNNWIVVHYDGFSAKYDQRVHVLEMKDRLRPLGSALDETDIEREIKEEMEGYGKGLAEMSEERGSKWTLVHIGADGNCLYRAFAHEIYGNQDEYKASRKEAVEYMECNKEFFQNFLFEEWEAIIARKSQDYEWGDHVDITALSEFYNVRVQVFELDTVSSKLFCSMGLGGSADPTGEVLPCVYLARHREKHYNIIHVEAEHSRRPRPLGLAEARAGVEPPECGIRQVRINEERKYAKKAESVAHAAKAESAHDLGDDDDDESSEESSSLLEDDDDDEDDKALLAVKFSLVDVGQVLAKSKVRPPLTVASLRTVFPFAMRQLLHLVENVWRESPTLRCLDEEILAHFYEGRYGDDVKMEAQSYALIQQLKSRVGASATEYPLDTFLSTFNASVCKKFCVNLASVASTQVRSQSVAP